MRALVLACVTLLAAAPTAVANPAGRVIEDADSITLVAKAYTVDILKSGLRMVTARDGQPTLAGKPQFQAAGSVHEAKQLTDWSYTSGILTLHATTDLDGPVVAIQITNLDDRYTLDYQVTGAERLGLVYELSSGRHWYGHGEIVGQPYPLETGQVHQEAFSPASYDLQEPFWYTATGAGLWVRTGKVMDVQIADGLGRFFIKDGGAYQATVFVEPNAVEAYRDYIDAVGKPLKSDATYEQYAKPMWNSWGQFYTKVDQQQLLDWAEGIHRNNIGGHTIQLDDKWEDKYGDLTFDPKTFPDPKAMSGRVHEMGFDFGIWVNLWINTDAANHKYAADHGYLLKDPADPAKPCTVTWWNGQAGVIDLANPAARAWYIGNLRTLMSTYRIDGFKFDTAFFNDACAPFPGYQRADYQRLGAELADQFDLQGAGIRVHWSGPQKYGFVTRTVDHGTSFPELASSVRQTLQVSTLGYPFVETDMIGGSLGQPPPSKDVLVRWAQAAALMPLMYSSTSPLGARDFKTGKWTSYDQETIQLYAAATKQHERLAPYIWRQVQQAVRTGDPIMRPVFFDFPDDRRFETVSDQWMLGPSLLAAPLVGPGHARDIQLPKGMWFDPNHQTVIHGPATLTSYPAPLGVTPAFILLGTPETAGLIAALNRTDVPAAGLTVATAGVPTEVTASVRNWSSPTVRDLTTSLAAPAGWTVEPLTPNQFAQVRYGQTVNTTWRVTPTPDARWGPATLTAGAAYGNTRLAETLDVQVRPVPGQISAPYRTTATADAQFAQNPDQFAIWAGGRDLSGWVDEKGAIYREDIVGDQSSVVVKVVSHEGSGPVAKAGIAVANDLAAPERGGYAVLVMTAQYGPEFMWDGDGNGVLDGWAGGGPSFRPVWLKLARSGTTYTAFTSDDGTAWRQIGTANVASASGTEDAGMVASAVNLNYPGQVTRAVFSDFTVGGQ